MADSHDNNNYVQRVQQERTRFTQNLLQSNDDLRVLAKTLETECRRLEDELARSGADRGRLIDRLQKAEEQSRTFAEQFIAAEQQNANLANLYVASYRLHSTLERREVLEAIQEIIINLVGSEEIAVYELDDRSRRLVLVASFGIDEDAHRAVPLGSGVVGSAAAAGALWVRDSETSPQASSVTACIPLVVHGRVIGAIAVFRLLQQKAGVEPIDRELFELLGTHAAMALYSSTLYARTSVALR